MQEGGATEVIALLDVGGYGTRIQCGDVDSGLQEQKLDVKQICRVLILQLVVISDDCRDHRADKSLKETQVETF